MKSKIQKVMSTYVHDFEMIRTKLMHDLVKKKVAVEKCYVY